MEYEKTLTSLFDTMAVRGEIAAEARSDETISITKGLPTPQRGRSKYPFREMEVGDSFFAPGASIIALHGCARRHRPLRITCRSVVENGVTGVRVWRIE